MLAVFDWNGTIFEQTDDEELNRYIGRELLKYEQRKLLNPLTLVSGVQRLLFLLGIKKELEEM